MLKQTFKYDIILILLFFPLILSGNNNIKSLKNLNTTTNPVLKQIRKDIRKTIYTIKSKRSISEMPELKFFKYRVKKEESFWKILSKASLDMDTLISINNLSSPKDIRPGKIIYISNMRGVIIKQKDLKNINSYLKKLRVDPEYVLKINKCTDFTKKNIFIPCGKISSLDRSLFLGSGFIYPVKYGRRSSGFGMRRNPFNRKKVEFHSGIDIACPIRTKVMASRSGKIIFAGYKGGYGNLVVIDHGHQYKSYYAHLSKFRVKRGDKVARGTTIAYSGNTGRSSGPHLHFEIRRKGKPVNPAGFLRRR